LKHQYDDKDNFIALFTATLWAVHPIQIQDVTLIVQLMTFMFTMFYILGNYFYLRARNGSIQSGHRRGFFFLCLISFLLALGCNENTIIFPMAFFLIESIFSQDMGLRDVWKKCYKFFFPVIGLKQEGLWPAMADRWAYIPFIRLFIIISWGGHHIVRRFPGTRICVFTMAAGFLFMLLPVTWWQVSSWKNSVTLFEHAVKATRNNYIAYNDLGLALIAHGLGEYAFYQFRKALEIEPGFYKTHINLGAHYLFKDKPDLAVEHLKLAIKLNPNSEKAYYNLGLAMLKLGKQEDAVIYFKKALTLKPSFEAARRNIERVMGRIDKNEP